MDKKKKHNVFTAILGNGMFKHVKIEYIKNIKSNIVKQCNIHHKLQAVRKSVFTARYVATSYFPTIEDKSHI